MPIKKIKVRKPARAKLIKIELKRLSKPYIASLKPTITALVFLLVSSFAQQLMDKIQLNKPCPPSAPASTQVLGQVNTGFASISRYLGAFMASVTSIETKAVELEGQTVLAGSRALRITRHAAERMIERGISKQAIGTAVNTGKLFAYNHANKIIKIGYYSTVSRVFVAVDQQHNKILTVIHNVPTKYIYKLINFISKPLSLNWSISYVTHSYLAGLAGVGWFVVLFLMMYVGTAGAVGAASGWGSTPLGSITY